MRARLARLPFSEAAFRRGAGMLPGTRSSASSGASVYEQLWTRPSLTVIAIEAHPLHGAANQILDSARARLSLRTVPNMDPGASGRQLIRKLVDEAAGRREGRGAHHAHDAVVDERPDRAGGRGGAARARARLRPQARADRIGSVDRLRQAVRRRARRAVPAHRRRGPGLRRALRGREPAPRRLEEVDALRGLPVRRARAPRARPLSRRRAGTRRPRAARAPAGASTSDDFASSSSCSRRLRSTRPRIPPSAAARPSGSARQADCAVPAGESAAGLVNEAVSLLGSPDSEWRDDVGYSVVATCVYGKSRLSAEERRALVATLRREPAARDRRDRQRLRAAPLLLGARPLDPRGARAPGPRARRGGLRAARRRRLAYLTDERDLRGLEPRVGWIHATAHTADLLKFLARDARFAPLDQGTAARRRLEQADGAGDAPVFTHAEDERLAAALVSLVRRPDFDAASLDPWLERFPRSRSSCGRSRRPTPRRSTRRRTRATCCSLLRAALVPRAAARREPGGRARESARHAREDPALTPPASRRLVAEVHLDVGVEPELLLPERAGGEVLPLARAWTLSCRSTFSTAPGTSAR